MFKRKHPIILTNTKNALAISSWHLIILYFLVLGVRPCFGRYHKNPYGNKNPWQVLNLDPQSSNEEIRKSYKKLALLNHPDRNPGSVSAIQNFKEAAWAFEQLTDHRREWSNSDLGGAFVNEGKDGQVNRSSSFWFEFGANSSTSSPSSASVEKWIDRMQTFYNQRMRLMAQGKKVSPIADTLTSCFQDIGGAVNIHRNYQILFQHLGADEHLMEAFRIFLNRNLPHYLSLQPSASEIIEIGNAAFNADFGRGAVENPVWAEFGKTVARLMFEAQEIATDPLDFVTAFRYEFSLEPFPGVPHGSTVEQKREISTRPFYLLWSRAQLFAEKFHGPPEELLIQLLGTLPSDYQSRNGILASTIFDLARGYESFFGHDISELAKQISPAGKFRIAILLRDIADRQLALTSRGYTLGNIQRRSRAWIEELKQQYPYEALNYSPHLSWLGKIATTLCINVLNQIPGIPASPIQTPPKLPFNAETQTLGDKRIRSQ